MLRPQGALCAPCSVPLAPHGMHAACTLLAPLQGQRPPRHHQQGGQRRLHHELRRRRRDFDIPGAGADLQHRREPQQAHKSVPAPVERHPGRLHLERQLQPVPPVHPDPLQRRCRCAACVCNALGGRCRGCCTCACLPRNQLPATAATPIPCFPPTTTTAGTKAPTTPVLVSGQPLSQSYDGACASGGGSAGLWGPACTSTRHGRPPRTPQPTPSHSCS